MKLSDSIVLIVTHVGHTGTKRFSIVASKSRILALPSLVARRTAGAFPWWSDVCAVVSSAERGPLGDYGTTTKALRLDRLAM